MCFFKLHTVYTHWILLLFLLMLYQSCYGLSKMIVPSLITKKLVWMSYYFLHSYK